MLTRIWRLTTAVATAVGLFMLAVLLPTIALNASPTDTHTRFIPMVATAAIPDYFDDFSDPASGWMVYDDGYVHADYMDGEYRVLSKRPGYAYIFLAPTAPRERYAVELDAHWAGSTGQAYGIVFGVKPAFAHYYLLFVNTDYREYVLIRVSGGSAFDISHGIISQLLPGTASNHLRIVRDGTSIAIEINGQPVAVVEDSHIQGETHVGVAMMPYSGQSSAEARFDNFLLSSSALAAEDGLAPTAVGVPTPHFMPQIDHWLPLAPTE